MAETEVTVHNKVEIRVQAQMFVGRKLISTCVVGPGEICTMPAKSMDYDIFFKDGSTGWEIARRLGSDANSFTLSQNKQGFILHVA